MWYNHVDFIERRIGGLKTGGAAWMVIHIAYNREKALEIQAFLEGEGFLVSVRPAGGSREGMHEVLALASEAKAARKILIESGLASS